MRAVRKLSHECTNKRRMVHLWQILCRGRVWPLEFGFRCGAVPAGDARFVGCFFDPRGDSFGHTAVEDRGNNIVGMKFVRADYFSNRVSRGELHRFIDTRGTAIQSTAEYSRKAKYVV